MADWLRAAGVGVVEVDGWQSRARSSGGFDGDRPWVVMWHHTASVTDPWNDVNYIVNGSPDKPISNLLLARDGLVYVCAAGATNTNGKGYAFAATKGTVPNDQMNTHAVSIEIANNGTGEAYSQQQIDAAFLISVTLTRQLGLAPGDVCNHTTWAPDRKIDPARAEAVQGPWRPRSINSSGSWNQLDVVNECIERAGYPQPGPDPGPPVPFPKGDDMLVVTLDANGSAWVGDGITRRLINSESVFTRYIMVWRERFVNTSGARVDGWEDVGTADNDTLAALGAPG